MRPLRATAAAHWPPKPTPAAAPATPHPAPEGVEVRAEAPEAPAEAPEAPTLADAPPAGVEPAATPEPPTLADAPPAGVEPAAGRPSIGSESAVSAATTALWVPYTPPPLPVRPAGKPITLANPFDVLDGLEALRMPR